MTRSTNSARLMGLRALVLLVVAMVLTSCGWRGIANLPVPVGPGTGKGAMTVYVQVRNKLVVA